MAATNQFQLVLVNNNEKTSLMAGIQSMVKRKVAIVGFWQPPAEKDMTFTSIFYKLDDDIVSSRRLYVADKNQLEDVARMNIYYTDPNKVRIKNTRNPSKNTMTTMVVSAMMINAANFDATVVNHAENVIEKMDDVIIYLVENIKDQEQFQRFINECTTRPRGASDEAAMQMFDYYELADPTTAMVVFPSGNVGVKIADFDGGQHVTFMEKLPSAPRMDWNDIKAKIHQARTSIMSVRASGDKGGETAADWAGDGDERGSLQKQKQKFQWRKMKR